MINFYKNYAEAIKNILEILDYDAISRVTEAVSTARKAGKSIYLIGNGGSSATASHFASDLVKGAICLGAPRIRAYALTDNTPVITAWANDKSYECVFAEQLENYLQPGDLLIAISGSGNSPNILRAVEIARHRGSVTVGFTGFDGGKLKNLVDSAVVVPSHDMEKVEDTHMVIEHMITAWLRNHA